MAEQFDVFMCHNSEDKPAVIEIATRLLDEGVKPWLDLWELRPGLGWQSALETQIEQIKTAAVFVGGSGIGPWQMQEIRAFLSEFVERGCPVIPVLLTNAPAEPELPIFLKGNTWVDFRYSVPEPFARLMWGVTGVKPEKIKANNEVKESDADPLVTSRTIKTSENFEERYLYCQASDCQTLRAEGAVQHDGIFVPLLREVFVPLELNLNASVPGYRALGTNAQSASRLDSTSYNHSIWDFLANVKTEKTFRQLAILAWGGYGKTTLLKHIAYRLGTKQPEKGVFQFVPFLLLLREHRNILAGANPPRLPELIKNHHIPNLAGAEDLLVPGWWAKDVLKCGRALVMFDGFDEVPKEQRPAVAKWLNEQMRQYGESVFILTSRPKAYKEQDASERLVLSSFLWVKNFDSEQRKNFVTRWYQCQEKYAHAGRETPDVKKRAAGFMQDLLGQIESQPELRTLAKNPLLLNMIVTFHRRYQGANLPKRKVELYQEICQLQLKDRPRLRKLETLLTECDAQTVLQRVAFDMMVQKLERVEKEQLIQLLTKALEEQEESLTAREFLAPVVEVSELIVRQEDEYEFAHLSFQEYLAAAYVAAKPERVALLYGHLNEDWWKPTILMYAGLVNPTKLLREAMVRGATSVAYECLQETRKRVDAGLKAELEAKRVEEAELEAKRVEEAELARVAKQVWDARSAELERYLQNGEWEKADKETYRIMITEVGKEEGQWFEPEDLLNFPCKPLREIDGLWVKHSGGKFGFSVQKEMYLECGGVPDGTYHEKAFEKLYEANGWKVDGEYSEFKFDTTSPKGHLPCVSVSFTRFTALAYRLVKCNL